jgi:2-(1,2-epoxy-1,2-dihydrophenyl)acetyl-CoA isomerase
MSDGLRIERRDRIAVVLLDRPERRNALDSALRDALADALERLMSEPDCRVLVLSGAGGTFCAGGDLRQTGGDGPIEARQRMVRFHRVVRALIAGPKPVIAAVEGTAYGAGMSLAAACDVVVTARDARFSAAFVRVGLLADMGLLWSLPLRVGLGRAKELLLDPEPIGGEEAVRIGLADRLAEPGRALDVALARAERLARAAPVAVATTKAAFARFPAPLEAMLQIEADGQGLLFGTEDHAEGRAAFFDKREPSFRGR